MKVSYLKKVLHAGSGTTFSENNQSMLSNKPSSSIVQLQQPIRNRSPFFMVLRDNQDDLGDVGEGIILDEIFEDISLNEKPGTTGDQDSEIEQEIESSSHLLKQRTKENGEVLKAPSLTQDDPLSVREKGNVYLGTTGLKMGRTDLKMREKGVKEDDCRLQEIEDKIDIQKLKVKKVQTEDRDRIPTVEIVKEDAIQIPISNQFSSPNLISKLIGINTESQKQNEKKKVKHLKKYNSQKMKSPEQFKPQTLKDIISDPQKEKIRIVSDIARQEEVHESDTLVKAIGVSQKPRGQQDLNVHFFTKSLKKGETQIAKIAKDVALITKKLDEHVSNEQSKPVKPVFLPKRPPSYNLGGWSNLERNYIR